MPEATPNVEHPVYKEFCGSLRIIHRVVRRSLQQIVENAEKVKSDRDIVSFCNYALVALTNLEHHHHHEEEVIFPVTKDLFPETKQFKDQHDELIPTLEEGQKLCQDFLNKKAKYDGAKLKALVEKLQGLVLPHLNQEEGVFNVEDVRKTWPDPVPLMKLRDQVEKAAQKSAQPMSLYTAFVYKHMSPDEQALMFKEVPSVVRGLLFPLVSMIHSDYWKYATTSGGEP
ncbi:hypothetical protein MIR68_000615 [Amoeboaphelidium protococcarum]|nr:hypothetical protein MIR68_000615 [Amoeboaphelidium protococcarum]